MIFTQIVGTAAKLFLRQKSDYEKNDYIDKLEIDFGEAQDIQDQTDLINQENQAMYDTLQKNKQNEKVTQYGSLAAVGIVVLVAVLSMKRS